MEERLMKWTPAWTDFAICFFGGWLGIHKFREHRIGLGILYLLTLGLFGIGWFIDCIHYFMIALKGNPNILDNNSPLPIVQSNLVLSNGETCHYYGPATYVKSKNVVVGYSGGHVGASIRVAKGMSIRTGSTQKVPIRGDIQERTNGVLSITNKRVGFTANKGAFDKKISALSAITPYSNGIAFQFGESQYPLECKNPEYVYQVLVRLINACEDLS